MSIFFFMTAAAICLTVEEAVEAATRPRYGSRRYMASQK